MADPQSRLEVIIIFTYMFNPSVRPSVIWKIKETKHIFKWKLCSPLEGQWGWPSWSLMTPILSTVVDPQGRPQSRLVVITIFTYIGCPSVCPNFSASSEIHYRQGPWTGRVDHRWLLFCLILIVFSHFRLTYYPHRLIDFQNLILDIFGNHAEHEVYADFKPLTFEPNPAFYIHVIEKPIS